MEGGVVEKADTYVASVIVLSRRGKQRETVLPPSLCWTLGADKFRLMAPRHKEDEA